jgi:tetratricopeptide (TPR) repeat protein
MKEKIAFFLQREAERIQSSALSKMALVLSTQADDDSTMTMIKNMLAKLLDDLQQKALADQTKKDACDKKLAVNKQTRAEKTASTEELQADLDVLQAEVAKFEKEIAELTEQVADLDSSVNKATEIRKAEKGKNAETISDAQAAQTAVAQATSVLKEFYEKAGQATALVQQQKSDQPAIFDSPYKGMGGESGGVVGMLEVIASDFAKLEAETKSEEETSVSEFEKLLKDSKSNKIQMTTDIKHKKESTTDSKARISEKGSEFDMEEQALNASLAEYDALKEECLNTGLDYEEEKKRREETIESLQKALTMLNNLATGVTSER